jgi:hypothetical protein
MKFFILVSFLMVTLFAVMYDVASAGDWPGVDEAVVERYAREYGREAQDPWINTDQGDLLLFVFTLAGAAGGFVAGYSWRKLFAEKKVPSTVPAGKCAQKVVWGEKDA